MKLTSKRIADKKGEETNEYPMLMIHKSDKHILLVDDRLRAVVVWCETDSTRSVGDIYTTLPSLNYKPYKGTVELSYG